MTQRSTQNDSTNSRKTILQLMTRAGCRSEQNKAMSDKSNLEVRGESCLRHRSRRQTGTTSLEHLYYVVKRYNKCVSNGYSNKVLSKKRTNLYFSGHFFVIFIETAISFLWTIGHVMK